MGVFKNLLGTLLSKFKLGLSGPTLSVESGELAIRNSDDDDYEALRTALVKVFGDEIVLNAGAAGSAADWVMKLVRPSTGMTTDIDIVLPAGVPSPGQGIRVASYSGGTVTLEYYTGGAGTTSYVLVDVTALAYGDSSPVAMFTKPANAQVDHLKVIIDGAFDGTPSLSVGISGTTSKYLAASHVDLTAEAGTVFHVDYGSEPTVGTEDLIATYSDGGATEGAARIQVAYVIPS